jgi:hypothetical protein
MHSFSRHRHSSSPNAVAAAAPQPTNGLVLDGGLGYDLTTWFFDNVWFRGQ